MTTVPPPPSDLPPGWSARVPRDEDVQPLAELVAATVTGTGSWTRRQLAAEAPGGELAAWVSVHDRAGGRTVVDLLVAPDAPEADAVAASLLRWSRDAARETTRLRQLDETQLDATVYADDERQQRWLAAAGYERARTWLQMNRPVDDAEQLPGPRDGVVVRRVEQHPNGLPVTGDIRVVHQMLEESFADHFNSYRESFPEFLQRLREDPGHRWDHWWIAEIDSRDGWQRHGRCPA